MYIHSTTNNIIESNLFIFPSKHKTIKVIVAIINNIALELNTSFVILKGFINATDLADYLVKKGMPFRTAYKIVGQTVAECIEKNKVLDTLTLDEYKAHSDLFDEDLFNEISLETCIAKRISAGSTGYKSVEKQIEQVTEFINGKESIY